jgi:hypothetical protein
MSTRFVKLSGEQVLEQSVVVIWEINSTTSQFVCSGKQSHLSAQHRPIHWASLLGTHRMRASKLGYTRYPYPGLEGSMASLLGVTPKLFPW